MLSQVSTEGQPTLFLQIFLGKEKQENAKKSKKTRRKARKGGKFQEK